MEHGEGAGAGAPTGTTHRVPDDDGPRSELQRLTAALVAEESSDTVLRRIAETVRDATGALAVHIERYPAERGREPIIVAGANLPSAGTREPGLAEASRIVISVGRRSERLGSIVIWRPRRAPAVPAPAVQRLEYLSDLVALALRAGALEERLAILQSEYDQVVENKHRLITGIAEELRNRLGAAAEFVQLLDTERSLSPRELHFIDRSRGSIGAAVHLINELVQLSRAEAGHLELNVERVNVTTLVRSIVRDYQLEIGTIGVGFDIHVPDGLPTIDTDIDAVRQVLDNLLSNAVRYTPAGGGITVTADVRPGRRRADPSKYVCISVRDTGPGIGDQDMIFEEVYRVERRGGTPGFRLAISRRIARLIGGELTLETGAGRGSTFTLWLPGSPPAAPPAAGPPAAALDASQLGLLPTDEPRRPDG